MMDHQTHLRNLAVSACLDDGCWGFRVLGQDGGDFQRDSCPQKARDEALSSLRSQLGLEFEDFPLGEMTDSKGVVGSLPHNTDCNPRVLLNNLVFLEQKIHDLQGVVRSMIVSDRGTDRSEEFLIRQQMVRADIASIIAQLLAVAGRLVPVGKQVGRGREFESGALFSPMDDWIGTMSNLQRMGAVSGVDDDIKIGNMGIDFSQLQDDDLSADILGKSSEIELPVGLSKASDDTMMVLDEELKKIGTNQCEPSVIRINEAGNVSAGDVEYNGVVKDDDDDDGEDENLVPGSYEVLELDKDEILAPHIHFCTICGKGFKRDANLRMHMRGHGDEYKTPEALAKPNKDSKSESSQLRRYSCPFEGCKRNQKHKKFQPLKTILCVKNHYKRSHCDKRYTCSRCHMKKFSVIADLKTHEKHCGQDRWQCSCGTTFSRKDKLFGHVALFQGHTPAIPPNETKGSGNSDGAGKIEKSKNDGGAVANTSLSLSATEQGVAGGDYIPSVNLNGDSGYERGVIVRTCPAPINISFGNGLNRDNFTGGSSVTERFAHSTSNMIGGSFPLQSRMPTNIFQSNVKSSNSDAL